MRARYSSREKRSMKFADGGNRFGFHHTPHASSQRFNVHQDRAREEEKE